MSPRQPWLQFERSGGSPPREDEHLSLADDGAFSARRTIGGPRIGTFEGRLSATVLARLRAAVDGVASADDVTLPTPRHGATEILEAAGRTLRLGSNEKPRAPWRPLIDRVRKLLENEVTEAPRGVIELVADARTARLIHRGSAGLDVDLGSVSVRVIRVADAGKVLGRWTGRVTGSLVDNGERLVPTPTWATAGPGWSAALPFDHPLELAPDDMFQVWVDLPVRDGGRVRDGRLYMPVLRDG